MTSKLSQQTLHASHRLLCLFFLGLGIFTATYWSADLYTIYQKQKQLLQQASDLRESIYFSAREFGQQVEQYDEMAAQQAYARARAAENQRNAPVIKTVDDNRPARPTVEDTNIPSKIQLLGVLEVELSETTSWQTVIKLIVSVLVTVLGIKTINYLFRRLENNLAH